MTSPLEKILNEALAGATHAVARELSQCAGTALLRANDLVERARVPLRVAEASLDIMQTNLAQVAALADAVLKGTPRNGPR